MFIPNIVICDFPVDHIMYFDQYGYMILQYNEISVLFIYLNVVF